MDNSTNQSIDTSTQPVQHPINNQRGNLPIILGVLVLLLLVGGGTYYLSTQRNTSQSSQVANPSPNASQQTNVVTSPTTKPITTDNISDWKNYTNSAQKYSVKYPSDWTVANLESGNRIHFRKVYPELGPHTDHSIYVTLQENKDGLSLKDWVTQNVVDPAARDYKKQNVDNSITRETIMKDGKTIEVVTGAHLPAAYDSLHAYFIVNNMVVEMALWPYNGGQYETDFDKKGKEILYNMVSTFQSTN